ncbi:MAG TPA: hypothetical protein VLT33_09910 [Labilithrix sp.]|nr:hypothetical protein [Labilithrix sp.]
MGAPGPARGTASRALFLVALPLALGVVAYAAWRSDDVRIVSWLTRLSPGGVQSARSGGAALGVPRVIVGIVPDLAWAFAFGAALALVWRGRAGRQRTAWIAAGGGVALACELGQAWGLVPGTFDPLDLLAIAVGYVAGVALSGRGTARPPTPAPTPALSRAPGASPRTPR